MTGAIGDITNEGSITPLTNALGASDGQPKDASFFSYDLTQLTASQITGIENGSLAVGVPIAFVTDGSTDELSIGAVGISAAQESGLVNGNDELAAFNAVTSAGALAGSVEAVGIVKSGGAFITSQVAAALEANQPFLLIGAYNTTGGLAVLTANVILGTDNTGYTLIQQAAAPPAGDLTSAGDIAPLSDGITGSASGPTRLSFFSFSLTGLAASQITGIELGTYHIIVDAEQGGGTASMFLGGTGVSASTAAALANGTPDQGLFGTLISSGNQIGTVAISGSLSHGDFDITGKVAAALEAGASDYVIGAYTPVPGMQVATVSLIVCFLAGTLIATPEGDVAVERLSPGDVVRTQRGEVRRIVWIGEGRAEPKRGRRNAATPVIVRKGALGDNVPYADLRVTMAHALHVDGVLIPVEFLVNHRSILWDDHAQGVKLYHIELETHDILLANGAPAESYRDDGNRWLFVNANGSWRLPPQPPCAPVLTGGPIVDAVWRRLLERAGPRAGFPLTEDPDLHLVVDGVRLNGTLTPPARVVGFRLPERPRSVRIVSRAAAPSELGLARDPRPLGVGVRKVALWRGPRVTLMDAATPSLQTGFHYYEAAEGLRWTDGDAVLPPGLFADCAGPFSLDIHLAGATRYPLLANASAG